MVSTKIFLFGIDRAGKTTLSELIKTGSKKDTKPTLAFNIDKWVIDEIEFQVWDAPGQVKFRKLWSNGINKAQVLLFVLDTADDTRFDEAKAEFDKVLKDLETARIPLVFCFNKMDLDEARANYNKARELFKLPLITDRKVEYFQVSSFSNNGIDKVKSTLIDIIQNARWNN